MSLKTGSLNKSIDLNFKSRLNAYKSYFRMIRLSCCLNTTIISHIYRMLFQSDYFDSLSLYVSTNIKIRHDIARRDPFWFSLDVTDSKLISVYARRIVLSLLFYRYTYDQNILSQMMERLRENLLRFFRKYVHITRVPMNKNEKKNQ